MAEVASGTVPIFPTFTGFRSAVTSEVESTTDSAAQSFGDRFRAGIGGAVRGIGIAVGTTLLAAAGTAAVGVGAIFSQGLDRALNLQDARAQLTGLGHDAESVQAIMDNALASVEGTAFGLDSAATVAASAVAAGIAPGEELTRTLTLTADAASIAGTSMDEMGSIINKVASSGRLTTDVLNQFHDRGVPLLQFIADEYGVTADAASEMVTRGEVDFATFQNALQNNVGEAAQASGDTARGAFANVGAALSRLGAMFLTGGVAGAPVLFQSIGGAVDRAAAALQPYADQLNTAIGPAMASLAGWIDGIDFGAVVAQVQGVVSGIVSAFQSGDLEGIGGSVGAIFAGIQPHLPEIMTAVQGVGAAFGQFAGSLGGIVGPSLDLLSGALGFLADNMETIGPLLPAIVTGMLLWNAATRVGTGYALSLQAAEIARTPVMLANSTIRLRAATLEARMAAATAASTASTAANTGVTAANTGAQNAGVLTRIRGTAAIVAQRVAMVAGTVASGAAAAAQWALNAAMSANPIMLIVLAIAALVGGLIWFFTQTELGQEIWSNFTQFLGEAWANVSAWFMAVGDGIATWWNGLWQGISDFFSGIWDGIVSFFTTYVQTMTAIYTAIGEAISTWWNGLWQGISDFFSAIWTGIVAFVTAYIEGLRLVITTVVDAIVTWWNTTWTNISTTISTIWNGIVSFVSTAIENVRSTIANVLGVISTAWQTGWNNVTSFITDAWNNISNGVQGGIDTVVSFVQGLPDQVLSVLGNLGNLLLSSGQDLIQGFIDGITGMLGAVGDAVGGVMDFVGGFFPNSPAKRGQFSGSGWTRVRSGGRALREQFTDGFNEGPALDFAAVGAAALAPGTAAAAAPGVSGGARNEPIYTDTGMLLGWIREVANGEARLVWNDGIAREAARAVAGVK